MSEVVGPAGAATDRLGQGGATMTPAARRHARSWRVRAERWGLPVLIFVALLVLRPGTSKDQLGLMHAGRFKTTADIALKFNVISKPADPATSYTNELVQASMKS